MNVCLTPSVNRNGRTAHEKQLAVIKYELAVVDSSWGDRTPTDKFTPVSRIDAVTLTTPFTQAVEKTFPIKKAPDRGLGCNSLFDRWQ